MAIAKEERDRILLLVESGQITALEASQLLDMLAPEQEILRERSIERARDRIVRIRATSMKSRAKAMHLIGTIPVSLLRSSVRLSSQFLPQLNNNVMEDLLQAIENHHTGRLLDLQDLENGERLEIFVE